MTTQLAWKNLWRNPVRSLVFLVAAFIGFAMALFALNVMKSIAEQRLYDAVNTQTSHLQIHREGFMADKDISRSIENADALQARIQAVSGVSAVAKRISSNAVVATPENSIACEIKGILPREERIVTVLADFLTEGEFLNDTQKTPVLVSKRTADKLKLRLRSKLIATVKNVRGEIVGASFRVVGIFATPNSVFDDNTVIARYDAVQALTGVSAPHEMAIKLTDVSALPRVQADIATLLKHEETSGSQALHLDSWKKLLPELFAFDGFITMVGVLFTVVIIIGLGFSILNIMNMIVQERIREIGMLRAIGQSKPSVFWMLVQEAVMLMALGAASGIALGCCLVGIVSRTGISISGGLATLGIRPVIYPALNPAFVLMISVIAVALTLGIAVVPALRALRIEPTTALRE
jgi:putative ABC transport system permease protein